MGPSDINWCEAIVAYKDNSLILYGAGSVFSCHAFDVGDEQQARLDLTTNRTKSKGIFSSGFPAKINWVTAWGYSYRRLERPQRCNKTTSRARDPGTRRGRGCA